MAEPTIAPSPPCFCYSDGDYEPHLRALFGRLVGPDWCCLDVGANIGANTLALAALATAGRVAAFEASARNFAHLQANAAALPPPKAEMTLVHAAAWDQPGSVDLADSDELAGGSHVTWQAETLDGLEQVWGLPDAEFTYTTRIERVAAIRLDDWVAANLGRVDLIKLDVEGAEQHALRGARQTLARQRPLLVTEYNPTPLEPASPPDQYFRLLQQLFETVQLIEDDGSLSEPLRSWQALEQRLAVGKGWEDLLCTPPHA